MTSTDSFISGSGNAFTAIFLTQSVQSDGSSFMATDAYSGIVSEAGIENFERAIVFANDQDTGNISIDLDGFSERVEDPPEGFDGSLAAVENLFSELPAFQALKDLLARMASLAIQTLCHSPIKTMQISR